MTRRTSTLWFQLGMLYVLYVAFSCSRSTVEIGTFSFLPDSLVPIPESGVPNIMFMISAGEGPYPSILLYLGRFYICSPPLWEPEPLYFELPIATGDCAFGVAPSMQYYDKADCLFVLVGNGFFRIPWGSMEADSVIIFGSQFCNHHHSNSILLVEDQDRLLVQFDSSLFLIEPVSLMIVDTLSFNSTIREMICNSFNSEVFLKRSDSIAVVTIRSDNLLLDRTLGIGFNPDRIRIGFAGVYLLGSSNRALYSLNQHTGQTTQLFVSPTLHRYDWRFPFTLAPYALRIDYDSSLVEIVEIPTMSVLRSFGLNLSFIGDLLVYVSPDAGLLYHGRAGGLFRFSSSE